MPLAPGQTFEGYTVEELIGCSELGEVYRAFDASHNRKVAIKIIGRQRWGGSPEAVARFLREARAAAALIHPNAIAVHAVGEAGGVVFLVTELVVGPSLHDLIEDVSVPVDAKLGWLVDVANALDTAHGFGIVHRGVKPSNIMITEEGTAKVLDFALANAAPRYMSPEQQVGVEGGARADQYAFGMTVLEAITGREQDPSWREAALSGPLLPGVPDEVRSVVRRMLADDLGLRYASMGEVAAALEQAAGLKTLSEEPATMLGGSAPDAAEPGAAVFDESVTAPMAPSERQPKGRARKNPAALRTRVAAGAHELADAVNGGFTGFSIGQGAYGVELSAPEGPSTSGGAQSLQHLKLVPRTAGYPTILVGQVSNVTHIAELRTFEHVAALQAQRFGMALPVDKASYDLFLAKSEATLRLHAILVKLVPPPPELLALQVKKKSSGQSPLLMLVAVGGLVLFVVGVIAVVFLR